MASECVFAWVCVPRCSVCIKDTLTKLAQKGVQPKLGLSLAYTQNNEFKFILFKEIFSEKKYLLYN